MNPESVVENRAKIPGVDFAVLADVLGAHRSIIHALNWLSGHKPPLTLGEMVTQDEFSHDIAVQYPGNLWIVYDTT